MKLIVPFLSILFIVSCGDDDSKNKSLINFSFPSDCCSSQLIIKEDSIGSSNVLVYLPPAIVNTENGNLFYPQSNDELEEIELIQIRDENDALVFENSNFLPNDPNEGWNGRVDGVFQDGKYSVIINMTAKDESGLTAEGVICVLECRNLDYFDRGLELQNCIWTSQHDGNGGFDPTLPGADLSGCF